MPARKWRASFGCRGTPDRLRGYRILKVAGGVTFETDDGHPIGQQMNAPVDPQMMFHPETARAEWGGARIDHDHLMFGLTQYLPTPEARAGPPN